MTFWNLAYPTRYFSNEKTCLGLVTDVWLLFYTLISHLDINHLNFPEYHHSPVWHGRAHAGRDSSEVCSPCRGILCPPLWISGPPLFSQWTAIPQFHLVLEEWRSSKVQSSHPLSPRPKHEQKAQDSQLDLLPRVLISRRGVWEHSSVGSQSFTRWHLEDSVQGHPLLLPSEQCCSCQSPGLTVVP